jgi:hypothetical protein
MYLIAEFLLVLQMVMLQFHGYHGPYHDRNPEFGHEILPAGAAHRRWFMTAMLKKQTVAPPCK